MIASYKKSGIIFIVLGFISTVIWVIFSKIQDQTYSLVLKELFLLISFVFFVAACYSLSRGKGYGIFVSILLGILGVLNIIGLIIIMAIPDKKVKKDEQNENIKNDKQNIEAIKQSYFNKINFNSIVKLKYLFLLTILIVGAYLIYVYRSNSLLGVKSFELQKRCSDSAKLFFDSKELWKQNATFTNHYNVNQEKCFIYVIRYEYWHNDYKDTKREYSLYNVLENRLLAEKYIWNENTDKSNTANCVINNKKCDSAEFDEFVKESMK